jgi:hypothetical protein
LVTTPYQDDLNTAINAAALAASRARVGREAQLAGASPSRYVAQARSPLHNPHQPTAAIGVTAALIETTTG